MSKKGIKLSGKNPFKTLNKAFKKSNQEFENKERDQVHAFFKSVTPITGSSLNESSFQKQVLQEISQSRWVLEDKLRQQEKQVVRPDFNSLMTRGRPEFVDYEDWDLSEEHYIAMIPGSDWRILGKLKDLQYKPTDRIDLHGFNQHDALLRLDDFLVDMWWKRKRCVLIIHGKSPGEGKDKLRHLVPLWLCKSWLAGLIHAFVTPPASYGGTGALLVLFKKHEKI